MTNTTEQKTWKEYCAQEIAHIKPILNRLGFSLDELQPHISGERYLTRPIGGAKKLVLLGRDSAGTRVVIKIGSDRNGADEIKHERVCRDMLDKMAFAHNTLHAPREILFTTEGRRAILISEFIEQELSFTERPASEQFSIALSILKAQEQAHATTYKHARLVRRTFGEMNTCTYLEKCREYIKEIDEILPNDNLLKETLTRGLELLASQKTTIEQYGGFLANWDLTPQNIRVTKQRVYFLDHASFHFGNKHESWARFINFMVLYQPEIAQALVEYVRNNRAPEELLSLKLMRAYRLVELIRFYVGWIPRTEGSVRKLAEARINFWHEVLKATLADTFVSEETLNNYKKNRDELRDKEEKERQIGLH